ncbi:Secondary metabolism regulator LAE1 [Talaromyces pinophilus]|nr:Secondary metabolism regulator LAE1 [Talaromyces pinophilus]
MMASGFLTPRRQGSFTRNDGSTSKESFNDNLSTNVLASPLQAYKYENNRRYHAYREGSYWGPNDEQDAYHQRVAHHLFTLVLQDRLYLAPIAQPRHVLDVGTGIGLWASNISDAHPKAQILGTDLSPLWHSDFTIRPNLTFEVDDCCSNWTYLDEGREPFDLIHIRCLYGSVKDWRKLYQQALEHLTPGRGWIEQVEVSFVPRFWYTQSEAGDDFSLLENLGSDWDSAAGLSKGDSNSIFVTWYKFWQECSQRTGKTWFVADQMASLIYEAGFENVCQARYMLPLFDCSNEIASTATPSSICGGYSDYPVTRLAEIARWFRQFWETGMEGWVLAVSTRYMGWTADEAKEFVAKTKEVLAEQSCRVYYELVVVYGQRPLLEG